MEKNVIDTKLLKVHEDEYKSIHSFAHKFCEEVKKQINELLEQNQLSLAFPIEFRVKTWSSLLKKIKEKAQDIKSVKEVHDLIGLRIILLFLRELPNVCNLLENNFKIIEKEDTITRLRENEFGYLSLQYIIELPESWFAIPIFSPLNGFRAEVQVRTAAQHIWAAASHKLQYKNESSVPVPVRRSIHRVSALLETVDLELDRVLDNRAEYIDQVSRRQEDELLNVDLLKHILEIKLPNNNRDIDEEYADLLVDLFAFEINTTSKLISLLDKHFNEINSEEASALSEARSNPGLYADEWERVKNGVFFTFTGLTRIALGFEFGSDWKNYSNKKWQK